MCSIKHLGILVHPDLCSIWCQYFFAISLPFKMPICLAFYCTCILCILYQANELTN